MIKRTSIFILAFLISFMCQGIFAQTNNKVEQDEKPQAKLIEKLDKETNSEVRSLIMDVLLNGIIQNPSNKGAIVVYCGKSCQYGEIDAHIRGIKNNMLFRNFPINRFFVINGGYKEKQVTEFWLIPENACPPLPESDIKIEDVKFKGKFKSDVVPYYCCS
jgi:hypothetical protein